MLSRLDEFLLDRVYQTIVDAFQDRGADCMSLTRSCLYGYFVFTFAHILAKAGDGSLTAFTLSFELIALMAAVVWLSAVNRQMGAIRGLNPHREAMRPSRYLVLLLSVVLVPLSMLGEPLSLPKFLDNVRILICLSSLYFYSCSNRPPLRRTHLAWGTQ